LNRFSSFQFQISSSEEPSTPINGEQALNPQPPTLNYQPSTESAFRLIYEKLPFFALTLAASVVTYFVQTSGRALWSPAERGISSAWRMLCGLTSVTSLKLFGRLISQLFTHIRNIGPPVW